MPDNARRKKMQAVHLLVGGQSMAHVAASLGVNPKTLWRWRQKPEFHQEIERLLDNKREEMRLRLFRLVDLSLEELGDHFQHSRDGKTCAKIALNILKITAHGALNAPVEAVSLEAPGTGGAERL
jgi:hypothetical protein